MESSEPRRTIVRAPNHLGDLVMALPALQAVGGADVMVRKWLAPLLQAAREGAVERGEPAPCGEVLALSGGTAGVLSAAAALRRRRYDRGILLTASFSSALIFRLGAVRVRRGLQGDGRGWLLQDTVPRSGVEGLHRAEEFVLLATGERPAAPPRARLSLPSDALPLPGRLLPGGAGPLVGIVPGSNATSRRWDADRFTELVRRLFARGMRVAVFGSADERELTLRVAGERGANLGGRTSLPELAAALAACDLVVANDTGPLHLAAAVGTPTLSLWGAGDPAHTGPIGEENQILRRDDLPCVPCVKNECPREGEGYELPRAERECLRIIGVAEVERAVLQRLEQLPTRSKDSR